jgi:DNA-binding transcriptional LysR family regulator
VVVEEGFVEILAAGCDAAIRYEERLAQDMIAIPIGPLIVRVCGGVDLAVAAAVAGCGVIHLFEDWLRPQLDSGAPEPVLQTWWRPFTGPFLYYPGCRHLPAPLRAFVDFVQAQRADA